MAINDRLGAAGTDLSQLPQGALKALGGSGTLQTAYTLADMMTPKAQEFDPALASLLYFTEMGKQASQPGATLLGSVVGSGQAPAAYMLKQAEAARARQAGIGKTAVQLAGVLAKEPVKSTLYTDTGTGANVWMTPRVFAELGPADQSKFVPAKDKTPKALGAGSFLTYKTAEDAKTFLLGQGLEEGTPNFNDILEKITVPTDPDDPQVEKDLLGEPLIVGGGFAVGTPLYIGGKISTLQIGPAKGAQVPLFTRFAQKRLDQLAKAQDTNLGKATGLLNQVDQGLNLLLNGARTGIKEEVLAPFRRVAIGFFGADIPGMKDFDNLNAISFAIAPGMRPPGAGSTSDMEFRAYQTASLDLGKGAEANYINLYALGKRTEAANALANLEIELLSSGKYRSARSINRVLKKNDPGIFEVYKGDLDDDAAKEAWYDSLPRGAVVNNGNGALDLFDDDGNKMTYVIKGWKRN